MGVSSTYCLPLRKKYSHLELFWSAFSRTRTEYSVSLRVQSEWEENADQNNFEYGHFSLSVNH